MGRNKSRLVVLSGAGISAESGLGTFRDKGGLWDQYDINEVATPEAWERNPELVLDFYNKRRELVIKAEPNPAHLALAELEKHYDVNIVTQNIDDLHERAGSKNILHLHGEILKAQCSYDPTEVIDINGAHLKLGDLSSNGYQLRPHVVWFGEPVPLMFDAEKIVSEADIFVVVGTSLNVYPAANLLYTCKKFCKKYIVDLNELSNVKFNNLTQFQGKATERVPELVDELIKNPIIPTTL
ncbi:MAG: NAD-dependent deacylase [Crocinitomicaceae bacterium]|nr:NAD-dependent deacylase [Crocinitomicaceae bacterium]